MAPLWKGAQPPPQNFFLILYLKMAICGAFLVQFFTVQLKLEGRKDTLAQVYFYWGGGNRPSRPPPGIEATGPRQERRAGTAGNVPIPISSLPFPIRFP